MRSTSVTRIFASVLAMAVLVSMAMPALALAGPISLRWGERYIPGAQGDFEAVQFVDVDTGFALTDNELWITENGGAHWELRTIKNDPFWGLGDSWDFYAMDFEDADNGWIVGIFNDWHLLFPSTESCIFYTDDAGRTWTDQSPNIDSSRHERLTGVDFYDDSLGVACGLDGVFLSTYDGGANWNTEESGQTAYDYRAVRLGEIVACAVGDGGLVHQFPWFFIWGPPTVRASGTGNDLHDVVYLDDGTYDHFFAVGDSDTYVYSYDNGTNWSSGATAAGADWSGAHIIDSNGDVFAYAVGTGGDGMGFTWASGLTFWIGASIGDLVTTGDLSDIFVFDDRAAWAVGAGGAASQRTTPTIEREAGLTRYTTAIAAAQSAFPDGSCDTTVVIATGRAFPDALSASGLAGAYDCPILLVGSTLTSDVTDELTRLGASGVTIIGGEAAVSASVETDLGLAGFSTERIFGSNRYETAKAVADKIASLQHFFYPTDSVFVVRGDEYADALAVAPFAFGQQMPVLLTRTGSLDGYTDTFLTGQVIKNAYIAGGEGAVGSAVKTAIDAILTGNGGSASERWSGVDRYETAAVVAQNGIDAGWGTAAYVGLSTGLNFPDALGGGAVAGTNGGCMLLTRTASLPSYSEDLFNTHYGTTLRACVFGGTAVVDNAVIAAIEGVMY